MCVCRFLCVRKEPSSLALLEAMDALVEGESPRDDIIQFCSGGFPNTVPPPPRDQATPTSSSEREEEEGNAVLRWAQRHQKDRNASGGAAGTQVDVVSGGCGLLESTAYVEDGDMPLIRRRKVEVNGRLTRA